MSENFNGFRSRWGDHKKLEKDIGVQAPPLASAAVAVWWFPTMKASICRTVKFWRVETSALPYTCDRERDGESESLQKISRGPHQIKN